MTNKERYEQIKFFADNDEMIGVIGAFLMDDAYKDVDFAKFIKKYDPQLFYNIHPIIMKGLEKQQKVIESCVALLENTKLSDKTKSQIAIVGKDIGEKCHAIAAIAKEMCDVFDEANKGE